MNEQNSKFISAKDIKCKYGMSAITLRGLANANKIKFIRSPGGKRYYDASSIFTGNIENAELKQKKYYAYCRVSSKKQADDLERQKQYISERFPNYTIVSDIGSGINWKQLQFSKILEQSIAGDVAEVVIVHRDRLCRFSFELMEKIFMLCGTKLTILNTGDTKGKSTEQELAEDLLSIIHIFNCKEMGRRRYKTITEAKTSNRNTANGTATTTATTANIESNNNNTIGTK